MAIRALPPIDREKFFKMIKYTPHGPEQRSFHESNAPFRVPCCGRRWGKSTAAGVDLAHAAFIPDSYWWICGPTYKLAEKEFRVVHDIFTRKLPEVGTRSKISYNAKQGDMRIQLPWNTIIECVSATNPDSLLGEGLDGVIMSEAAEHSRATWESYIEPALSDKKGQAIFPSTPKGYNFFHGLFELGQPHGHPDYESWQMPTWTNHARYPLGLNDEYLLRIRSQVSENYWRQQYGAEFVVFEGQIYDEFAPKIHIRDIQYQPMWKNFIGLDFGFTAPTVALDIMVDSMDNCYVWREYVETGRTAGQNAYAIRGRDQPAGYHLDGVMADPRGADQIATMQSIVGVGFNANHVPWDDGIEAVKQKLKLKDDGTPSLYIDKSCTHLIRQMQGLRRKPQKEGKDPQEGQVDYDDHGPDALRYFCGEYFFLGSGGSLSDVYDTAYGSEGETFFQERMAVSLVRDIGF